MARNWYQDRADRADRAESIMNKKFKLVIKGTQELVAVIDFECADYSAAYGAASRIIESLASATNTTCRITVLREEKEEDKD